MATLKICSGDQPTVVKQYVFLEGGHWKVRLHGPVLDPTVVGGSHWGCQNFWYRVAIFPSWARYICATDTKMLRLLVRLRPSAGLTRPGVLSASGRPRTSPVTCHPKGHHSGGSYRSRNLCHNNYFYYGVTSKSSSLLPLWDQSRSFQLSKRFYSLPPHQKVTLMLAMANNW